LLLPPALVSFGASRAMAMESTREQARRWLGDHLAPGAAVLVESYGPRLPAERWAVWNLRFAARVPVAELRAAGVDRLVLAAAAYSRFLDPAQHSEPQHAGYAAWYEEVFATLPLAARFTPDDGRWGPEVRIYELPLAAAPPSPPRRLAAGELFVPDGGMRQGEAVVFGLPGQWCAAKLDLAAGRWRVRLTGDLATATGAGGGAPGVVRLATLGGVERGGWALAGVVGAGGGSAATEIAVGEPGRHLLYLDLPPGSRLDALVVAPAGPPVAAPGAPAGDG